MNESEPEKYFRHQRFIQQLTRWSVFGFVYAAPCFVLAYTVDFRAPIAFAAMFCGVVSWITLMTYFTTRFGNHDGPPTAWGKAFQIGLIVRGVIAVMSLYGVLVQMEFALPDHWIFRFAAMPDMLSGMYSCLGVSAVAGDPTSSENFFIVYIITLFTGLGVLFSLQITSLIIWPFVGFGRFLTTRNQPDE